MLLMVRSYQQAHIDSETAKSVDTTERAHPEQIRPTVMNARLEPSGSISPARKVRHLLAQPERRCVPLWRPDWVVDHQPTALHERVADFGADKFEPTLLERLGHLDGSRVLRRHLAEARPAVELGAAAN
eukprot:6184060-Pleurochrysis_carterae.AAC.1